VTSDDLHASLSIWELVVRLETDDPKEEQR